MNKNDNMDSENDKILIEVLVSKYCKDMVESVKKSAEFKHYVLFSVAVNIAMNISMFLGTTTEIPTDEVLKDFINNLECNRKILRRNEIVKH